MQMADEQLEEERRPLGSRIRILFSLDGRTLANANGGTFFPF